MSGRDCALKSAAFGELKSAFENKREAILNLAKSGKKMVWMLGDDVPEEVILAAGMLPIRLSGYYGPRPNADKYLEISFGALWRGLFEAIMNDEYAGLMDYLVLSNSSDIIQRLYYYLLELKRTEPERKLPVLDYVDYALMPKEFRTQERNLRETKEFISRMEALSGRKITDKDLTEAAALMNEYKQALRKFAALRYEGRVTGSEALTAIAGSFYLEKEKATALILRLTEDARSWDKVDALKAFYTGSMQETTEVYELLEECGINVISEDKLFGDRYADCDTDLSLPPARAISSRYHNRFPSSERGYVKERAQFIPGRIAEIGAEALIIFMNHNDESYIWDYPKQKIELDKMGLMALTVEDQYYPLRDKAGLKEKFTQFVKTVKGAQ